jgi:actin-related protein
MLAALPNFSSQWITKAAYDERGPSIVQSACPD